MVLLFQQMPFASKAILWWPSLVVVSLSGKMRTASEQTYPLALLGDSDVHDSLGDTDVIVFSQADGTGGAAYLPRIDGRRLSLFSKTAGFRIWRLARNGIWQDGRSPENWLAPSSCRCRSGQRSGSLWWLTSPRSRSIYLGA